MTIQNLYFGKDDAETDFTNSGLLREGFLKTAMYEAAKSGSKSLIIGRKGSGKSALCLMLHKQLNKDASACIITPDAISANEIRRFEMVGVDEQQSKKLVWRYVFLVQICKFLLEVARQKWDSQVDWPSEVKKVRQFLVENNEVDDINFQENFWRIINRIKTALTFSAFGQSIELEAQDAPNEGLGLNLKLDFLEKYLKTELSHLDDSKFYLLVDKIDEIWDNDTESALTVVGLLMAMKEINRMCSNVHCVVFLRSDIYDQLQFFDKDKLRGDEEPIIWSQIALSDLILARARASTKNQQMGADGFWSEYFPSHVDGASTSDFLLAQTLMRPRDIIQLCNLCVDMARQEGHVAVRSKHVLQAVDMYSNWKLNDLIGEYRVNYPFLSDLLIIFSNTSYVIKRQRFENVLSRVSAALEERYSDYKKFFTADSVLNILYGIGFLGVERAGKAKFYYQDPKTVEDSDRIFIVHPAFRNALKCTSSIDMQSYSPEGGTEYPRHIDEIGRSRSPIRGEFESTIMAKSSSPSSDSKRFSSRLDSLRREVIREKQLPAEVASEISRNLSIMVRELEESRDYYYYDPIRYEVIRMNITRYLTRLREKLDQMGFLSQKSSLNVELARLTDYY